MVLCAQLQNAPKKAQQQQQQQQVESMVAEAVLPLVYQWKLPAGGEYNGLSEVAQHILPTSRRLQYTAARAAYIALLRAHHSRDMAARQQPDTRSWSVEYLCISQPTEYTYIYWFHS
jgi:hypothetical protein